MELLWEEIKPGVILFVWLDFLQEELLSFLDLEGVLDISGFAEKPPDETQVLSLENLEIASEDKNVIHWDQPEKNSSNHDDVENEGDSGFETSTSLSSASPLASPQTSSGRGE